MSFFGELGSGISSIFGGIGSEAAASGYRQAAEAYGQAAHIAGQNANLEVYATKIQSAQTERKVEEAIGSETADVAGANLAGGTAGDLMRSSIQQGALATSIVNTQGAINRNSFLQQAEAYTAMQGEASAAASAASASGLGGILGGALSIGGALFSLF